MCQTFDFPGWISIFQWVTSQSHLSQLVFHRPPKIPNRNSRWCAALHQQLEAGWGSWNWNLQIRKKTIKTWVFIRLNIKTLGGVIFFWGVVLVCVIQVKLRYFCTTWCEKFWGRPCLDALVVAAKAREVKTSVPWRWCLCGIFIKCRERGEVKVE